MSDTTTVASAVAAAINCNWKKAVEINQKLLAVNPTDIDCLNRLGKAYLELGEKDKAITIFRKVLRLSKYDSIAQKNLDRAKAGKIKILSKKNETSKPLIVNFLEEPGKTKLVALVNLAPASTLLKLSYGDGINLAPKRHTVLISDRNDNYLGALPDDLGHRLSVLMSAGNTYDGLVKSIGKTGVVILIRELSKTKKFKNTPSFPSSNSDYFSFVRDETLEKVEKPVVTPTEADTEEEADESPAHLHADEETEE